MKICGRVVGKDIGYDKYTIIYIKFHKLQFCQLHIYYYEININIYDFGKFYSGKLQQSKRNFPKISINEMGSGLSSINCVIGI